MSTFREDFQKWAEELTSVVDLDGIVWYTRVRQPWLKILIFTLTVCVIFLLPIIVGVLMMQYAYDVKVLSSLEWHRVENVTYPNITVCNSKYFDVRRMAELNVSNDMANYITMALDSTLYKYYAFMMSPFNQGQGFQETMEALANDLDAILNSNNITLLQLFHKLAIRCEDFVMFCEIHREIFISPVLYGGDSSLADQCCKNFFNPEPIFTLGGTCFTSNKAVVENSPSTFSSIKIWFDLAEERTPNFTVTWKGSDAIERQGAFYSISLNDAPAVALSTDPRTSSAGTSTIIGLKRTETERSGLAIDKGGCLAEKNETFETIYGVEQTKKNCEFLSNHYLYPNCSIAPYFGFKQLPNLPPCKPKDMLSNSSKEAVNTLRDICPYDCHRVDFEYTVTTMKANLAVLGNDLNKRYGQGLINVSSYFGIQLYFQSFDYSVTSLYQEGFFDFLSQVGGTLGLFVGASIISIIEVLFFIVYFIRILFRHSLGCCYTK